MAGDKRARASDGIMPPDRMKPSLLLSKSEPVQAAIGLTGEGEAVILLDKHVRPRKVAAMLRTKAVKEKIQLNNGSVRFGRAEVDADHDAATVRFWVNKDVPGAMRAKLLEVLRRVPFAHVEINVDPALDQEPEEDGAAHADGAAPLAAFPAAPLAAFPAASSTAPSAASLGAPAQDAHAMNHELAALMKRIAAMPAASASRAPLVKLAAQANAHMKAAELPRAGTLVAALRHGLDGAAPLQGAPVQDTLVQDAVVQPAPARPAAAALAQPHAGVGPGAAPATAPSPGKAPDPKLAFVQARLRYDAGRKQVAGDVGKLMDAMRKAFAAEPDILDIDAAIEKFARLRDLLDDRLADQLSRGCDATSDDDRTAARKAALDLLDEYSSSLGYHAALLAGMDRNPFVPVTVEAVLPRLLADLAARLR